MQYLFAMFRDTEFANRYRAMFTRHQRYTLPLYPVPIETKHVATSKMVFISFKSIYDEFTHVGVGVDDRRIVKRIVNFRVADEISRGSFRSRICRCRAGKLNL